VCLQLLERAQVVANATDVKRIKAAISVRNKDYIAFVARFRSIIEDYRELLPGIAVRRVGWGHVRSLEATNEYLADPGAVHYTSAIQGDLFGHGKQLGRNVTDADILCDVALLARRAGRVLDPARFRERIRTLPPEAATMWAWHPLCWEAQANVCLSSLSGRRPMWR
jgi:hypothetical protein